MALISAHRCGAGKDKTRENTMEAILSSIKTDCDFVEFDVQRCKDGVFVLYHNPFIVHNDVTIPLKSMTFAEFAAIEPHFVRLEECLRALRGKKKAHVDFKFTSPKSLYSTPDETYEVIATQLVLDIMGAGEFIITTMEDESVAAVRDWSRRNLPDLLVGLSLGKDRKHLPVHQQIKLRWSEAFPTKRFIQCDANFMVAKKSLARLTLARWARKRDMPLLVWTVDDPQELDYWLQGDRAWLVTSNYLRRALVINAEKQAQVCPPVR